MSLKILPISFIILALSKQALSQQSSEFTTPWLHPQTSIIIDAYQGNSIDWKKMTTDSRVVAVIHRASIGLKKDAAYAERKARAKQNGYLWGAYHLGKSGDPIKQAQLFLKIVGDDDEVLMALDLEDTTSSSMMSVANALKFLEYIFDQTGRVPVIYANHKVTQMLTHQFSENKIFRSSRLWYARFRSQINDFPQGLWPTYFLWQFSSEINCTNTGRCLYNVPGTEFDMDVNVFYGTREALAQQWH